MRVRYAGPVSRAVAFVLDAALIAGFAIGLCVGVVMVGAVLGLYPRQASPVVLPGLLVAVPARLVCYEAVFCGLAGRTPGMAVLGVRVTTVAGRPVPWSAAVVRAVVAGYFPVGFLWCLVDRRRQAVHDKLARTVVVLASSGGQP